MPIQLKRSAVAGKVPTTAQLSLGELAVNTRDGRLFLKKDNGTEDIIEFVSSEILHGQVAYFAMTTAPTGWLKCNGAAISRTAYADLFAAIGTTFGAGNGSTTFNLPDLRGEFPRGWDDGRGVDSGRMFGSAQGAAMLNHTHSGTTSTNGSHQHSGGIGFAGIFSQVANSTNNSHPITANTGLAGDHNHTVTTGNPSVGGGNETRPRNVALLACIKY